MVGLTYAQLQSPEGFIKHTDAQTPPHRGLGSVGLQWDHDIASDPAWLQVTLSCRKRGE